MVGASAAENIATVEMEQVRVKVRESFYIHRISYVKMRVCVHEMLVSHKFHVVRQGQQMNQKIDSSLREKTSVPGPGIDSSLRLLLAQPGFNRCHPLHLRLRTAEDRARSDLCARPAQALPDRMEPPCECQHSCARVACMRALDPSATHGPSPPSPPQAPCS